MTAGTLAFAWPNLAGGFGAPIKIGDLDTVKLQNALAPDRRGVPGLLLRSPCVRDPVRPRPAALHCQGEDTTGDGQALNVRALYQRCPHLGCKPNPCLKNFWFECPCHGSRYDRLGIKADGAAFGPAPRGMDRFSITVDGSGVLTINTGKITLGPLPVALGQPGLIPPRTPTGCI